MEMVHRNCLTRTGLRAISRDIQGYEGKKAFHQAQRAKMNQSRNNIKSA
jgi:hypothetical protein